MVEPDQAGKVESLVALVIIDEHGDFAEHFECHGARDVAIATMNDIEDNPESLNIPVASVDLPIASFCNASLNPRPL